MEESIHNLATKQFARLKKRATDKYWRHTYTPLYDRHIGGLKDIELKILELGVYKGASLLLWKEAFPKAKIYGVDKNLKPSKRFLKDQNRIEIFQGRQEDVAFLIEKIIPNGPFDIIIDDGGHNPGEQQSSFEVLWNCLNKGGWYIMEDIQGLESTMDYLKGKIDEAQKGFGIKSMSFHYNICFIEKA